MGIFSGKVKRRRSVVGLIVLSVMGLIVLSVMGLIALHQGVQNIGPAWKAKQGEGVIGTFTATHEVCGRRSCTVHGTFTAADGSTARKDLILNDSGDALELGDKAPALDAGAPDTVFPPDGGGSLFGVSIGFILAGAAVVGGWAFFLIRVIRRRRAVSAPRVPPQPS